MGNISETRFKSQLKDKVNSKSSIYPIARSLYRTYCNFEGPLHLLPDFIIFGVSRSGTTSLYQYLSQHPNIEPCAVKEPRFFDMYYERGINWYKMNFPSKFQKFIFTTIKHKKLITGEASGAYLQNPHAPKRIHNLNPNMKLILLLRNPVDRAFSHYIRKMKNGSEKLSFEEVVEQEKSRIEGEQEKMEKNEKYYSSIYHSLAYITTGLYAIRLKHWLKYFPMKQILVLENGEFLRDPEKVYNQAIEFLDLPKWKLSKYKKFSKQRLSINMDSKTREKLLDYCKPFNKELYSLIGKKFDWDK
tara:strand:- start:310 stop:1215 length:906 start_codon:yes stop_codon:yes gene_type:complete